MYIRKIKTKSGAVAIQVAQRIAKRDVVIKHIGSAHSQEELTNLIASAHEFMSLGQASLFDSPVPCLEMTALSSSATFLYDTLGSVYRLLHFDKLGDEIFEQLVVARLIEPSSKLDTIRILEELGIAAPSYTGIHRCLQRVVKHAYRDELSKVCMKASGTDQLSLLLYDVTTLYFEIQKEDEFRKPGMSKERRLEPQIVVGLLVDRSGFPLELHEFEGNLAETKTLIPVITAFCQKHSITTSKITITADAGMLSAKNLVELEDAGFSFIVGSRLAKTPYEIATFAKSDSDQSFTDKQIFEAIQVFGYRKEEKTARRVIYQYREKRAQLDLLNIEKHITKARSIINGTSPLKKAPFLTLKKTQATLNQDLIEQHKLRAGMKGYVTNLPTQKEDTSLGVAPQEIIAAYHQLFQVEKSFRMSKSDLKARPIFHHKLDSIKAHLTIVFAALAIARFVEARTHISIKKFIQKLKVIHTPTILVNGVKTQVQPHIPEEIKHIVENFIEKPL